MNPKTLTKKYLDSYLLPFVEQGKTSDNVHTINRSPVDISQAYRPDCQVIDMHTESFLALYNQLQEATLRLFIDRLVTIDNLTLVDIGGLMSEDFGAIIASENPDARVHTYDPKTFLGDQPKELFPDCKNGFPNYLFDNRPGKFSFSPVCDFNPDSPEESINQLYNLNCLFNLKYHHKSVNGGVLEQIIKKNKGRHIVLYTRKVPEFLNELVASVANKHDIDDADEKQVVDLILIPAAPEPSEYNGDNTMNDIRSHHKKVREGIAENSTPVDPASTAQSRLWYAMRQYIALRRAESHFRAKVYRDSDHSKAGFPFYQPTHIVSTINPSEKHQ